MAESIVVDKLAKDNATFKGFLIGLVLGIFLGAAGTVLYVVSHLYR